MQRRMYTRVFCMRIFVPHRYGSKWDMIVIAFNFERRTPVLQSHVYTRSLNLSKCATKYRVYTQKDAYIRVFKIVRGEKKRVQQAPILKRMDNHIREWLLTRQGRLRERFITEFTTKTNR